MEWIEVSVIETTQKSYDQFCRAVDIWIRRPNVVNKQLSHATPIVSGVSYEKWPSLVENLSQRAREEPIKTCLEEEANSERLRLRIRSLVPKNKDRSEGLQYDAIIEDKDEKRFIFVPLNDGSVVWESAYQFRLDSATSRILLLVSRSDAPRLVDWAISPSVKWLAECLLPKIVRWTNEDEGKSKRVLPNSLVGEDRYSQLYTELKRKYGRKMAEIWPDVTVTDPQKFVYEDIAIATYLLLLWQDEREQKQLPSKQTFADLGCGNGLLVYILTSEGHCGYGIDVRRRKIWDMYGDMVCLKEMAIMPSNACLFPDADWIIGNHSDELTPWIPLMAARSSSTTCYFVLPCCFFDFDKKYSRESGGGHTQYRSYLDYVKTVGEECGFHVKEDKLRIPSTKNFCQIGMNRNYATEAEKEAEVRRSRFLASRCSSGGDSETATERTDALWATDFRPRSPTEKTRNCMTVDKGLQQAIVRRVVDELIARSPPSAEKTWRRGGSLKLSEAASLFDQDVLVQLKSECGGLQTLLKNQHPVFIVSGGHVELRDWSQHEEVISKTQRKRKRKCAKESSISKRRLCWFFIHHPDGCPRSSEKCPFAHGDVELNI
ncbi:probable tRNA (uracil-O(2)-)-methyltransferase isoform X2 [Oscarella lobularis]